jgi:hypothetical protein
MPLIAEFIVYRSLFMITEHNNEKIYFGLFGPNDDDTTILRNVGNCLPKTRRDVTEIAIRSLTFYGFKIEIHNPEVSALFPVWVVTTTSLTGNKLLRVRGHDMAVPNRLIS